MSINFNNWFFGLLGLMFIFLKLTGQIDWSWWLVLLPLWGPFVAFIATAAILVLLAWATNTPMTWKSPWRK